MDEGAATAAIIAAIVSAVVAFIIAFFQASRTAREELAKRQSALSVEIAKLLLDPSQRAEAARRFAVGIIKVVDDNSEGQAGSVCFVPLNSRATLGREAGNDIVLSSQQVSRFHCGFYAEPNNVYVEDYGSQNGTFINSVKLNPGEVRQLNNGDFISIGSYKLEFRLVHKSSLLTS